MFTGIIYCAISPSNKKYYGFSLKTLEERKQKHFLNMLAGSKLRDGIMKIVNLNLKKWKLIFGFGLVYFLHI
jgi:hypothetical protein